jgi:hypothetical protein
MEGGEEIGAVITGVLAARAVEPGAGEAGGESGAACLNCGTRILRRYCPECGQAAHVHRTLGAFWHDIAHSVLHFEGNIWRTLPLLAWRPGELTRRYVEGERARFVSPMALFLFTVFLMFAVFSAFGPTMDTPNGQATQKEAAEVDQAISALEAQRTERIANKQDTKEVDEDLQKARAAQAVLRASGGMATKDQPFGGKIDTGWPKLDAGLKKANENPALLLYKLQSNAYKFSWALIPISLPFLWLLFLHRRRYRQHYGAYDHLVFVTYSITFMSLALITFLALRSIGIQGGFINFLFVIVPPLHMYRQLRGAYQLRRRSALWRSAALLFFASIALTLFSTLLLALGVLG